MRAVRGAISGCDQNSLLGSCANLGCCVGNQAGSCRTGLAEGDTRQMRGPHHPGEPGGPVKRPPLRHGHAVDRTVNAGQVDLALGQFGLGGQGCKFNRMKM